MEILPHRQGKDIAPDKAFWAIETLKAESAFLRGQLAEELASPADHFSDESAVILRQHGILQQINRDRHGHFGDAFVHESTLRGENVYQFMVRTGVPGGRLSSEQLLAQLALCDEFGDGRLKITWRQNIELHCQSKENLVEVLRRINASGLTTLGSCGDMNRNVVCCPAPYRADPVHDQMQAMARAIAGELAPRTPAYRDIWLEGMRGEGVRDEAQQVRLHFTSDTSNFAPPPDAVEPLYGPSYLPNKLKIAIGLPGDNCADVYAHDIGLLTICENFNVVGYNLLVGGGIDSDDPVSNDPDGKDSDGVAVDALHALARPIAFVWTGQTLEVVRAIVRIYRDCGMRTHRSRTRLKYMLALLGDERFKAQIEAQCGYTLAPPRDDAVWDIDDHLGWHEQGDGRWFYGMHLPNGRIEDTHRGRWKSALREICQKRSPPLYLATGQNLLIGDIRWEDRLELEDHFRRYAPSPSLWRPAGEISSLRRWSSACGSLPTCASAPGKDSYSESERALPGLLDQLETELLQLGLQKEQFSLRMSGCPKGCTRPYMADIGIVGRGAGRYAILLGGRRIGDRLGFLYQDGVPLENIAAVLADVFRRFTKHRNPGEQLGDFCFRLGCEGLKRD
jgi:sulfite reductase (ferredoxin)